MTVALDPGPSKVTLSAGHDSRRRRTRSEPPRELVAYAIEPSRRTRRSSSSSGRRTSTCSPAIDRELVRAIDFGMFAFIVVPLLRSLNWINGYVGNYGWSIIILTIIINARDVPAAAQERGVDAEDAGDPAGGEGDPGSLREAEGDRSRRSRR